MNPALRLSLVLFALAGATLIASLIYGAVTTGEQALGVGWALLGVFALFTTAAWVALAIGRRGR
jgi:hypothetical protein